MGGRFQAVLMTLKSSLITVFVQLGPHSRVTVTRLGFEAWTRAHPQLKQQHKERNKQQEPTSEGVVDV